MTTIALFRGRGPSRTLAPVRRYIVAFVALWLAASAGIAVAQSPLATTSAVSTRVSIEHSAVERSGLDFALTEWAKAEKMTLAEPVRAESLLPYATNLDTRLSMGHVGRATSEITKGLRFGQPPQGPSLKVETADWMRFNGNGIDRDDGTAWRHSRSELEAEAAIRIDLSVVSSGPRPSRLVFYWKVDGNVEFDLAAPTDLAGSTNWLSVYAQEMTSTLSFGGGVVSSNCPFCIDKQEYTFGVHETSFSTSHPRYTRAYALPPQEVAVGLFVDKTTPDLMLAYFALYVRSINELWNNEYGNQLLDATMNARFNNSATLLGVQALDADGLEMSGVSYLASDPDLFIPVYSPTAAVPEPGAAALMLAGLLATGAVVRRSRIRSR